MKTKKNSQFAGVTQMDSREVTNNTGLTNQMMLESDDIDAIESRNKRFSKRYQIKASVVRRF